MIKTLKTSVILFICCLFVCCRTTVSLSTQRCGECFLAGFQNGDYGAFSTLLSDELREQLDEKTFEALAGRESESAERIVSYNYLDTLDYADVYAVEIYAVNIQQSKDGKTYTTPKLCAIKCAHINGVRRIIGFKFENYF